MAIITFCNLKKIFKTLDKMTAHRVIMKLVKCSAVGVKIKKNPH